MCVRVCVKIINVYFAVPTHSEPLCVQSKAQVMLPNRQVASKCGASHADNVELIKCVLVATSVSSSVLSTLCVCVCLENAARDATAALSKLAWQLHSISLGIIH